MLAALLVPLLIAAADLHAAPPDGSKHSAGILHRTIWADTGVSTIPGKLAPKQIQDLCKAPAMLLEKADGGLVQTFYAGIAMSTRYAPVKIVSSGSGSIVSLYNPANGKLAETLEVTNGGRILVQKSSHFRPHVYVRCYRWERQIHFERNDASAG